MPGLTLFGELAQSENDENTLSTLDKGNDDALAYQGGLRLLRPFKLGRRRLGEITVEVSGRVQEAAYESFDRTRDVGFNRLWNLDRTASAVGGIADSTTEATVEALVRWQPTPADRIQIEAGQIQLGSRFDGLRGALELGLVPKRLPALTYRLDATASEDGLASQGRGQEGQWIRQRGSLRRTFGTFTPLVEFDQERRSQRVRGTDSLAFGSFGFYSVRPGVAYAQRRLSGQVQVEYRQDSELGEGALRTSSSAVGFSTEAKYTPSAAFRTEAKVSYRRRRFVDFFRERLQRQDNESVAVRLNARAAPFKRAIQANAVYEALTERTPILQEVYVLVGQELGQFVWTDGSGSTQADGVEQLDEFTPETQPLEGTYVKTFVPSDELFPTIGVQARLRVGFDPGRWGDREGTFFQQVLANVSTQTTVDVREKSRSASLASVYFLDPRALQVRDSVLVDGALAAPTTLSGRFRIVQEVELFKAPSPYGLRLSGSSLTSTSQLAAGLETRRTRIGEADARYTPRNWLTARLRAELRRDQAQSTTFTARTFDIRSATLEPEATVRPSSWLTLVGSLSLAQKTDQRAAEAVEATLFKIPLEARLAFARKLSVTVRGERADVRLSQQDAGGLASFELTDGRGPGTSYRWGVTGQYAINSFLRATLFYDGQARTDRPTLQTVRVQFSASF